MRLNATNKQTNKQTNLSWGITLFMLFLFFSSTFAQGDADFCQSYPGNNPIRSIEENFTGGESSEKSNTLDEHYLRIYVHVIRDDNGNGGMTESQVQASLDILYAAYSIRGIYFERRNCEINYIDNSTYFEHAREQSIQCEINGAVDANNELLYSHDDGIDIFYDSPNYITTPNGDNIAGGTSSGIPGSSFFLYGVWIKSVTQPTVSAISSIIVHEMGHCLGLWHTHHGVEDQSHVNCEGITVNPIDICLEYVMPYNFNGYDCGDYVGDTPADPFLNHNVNPNGCTWSSSDTDPFGYQYFPDLNNYMSYSSIECANSFSDGQAERMHQIIEMAQVLIDCTIYHEKVVTATETWTPANTPHDGDFIIEGDLTIEAGGDLTIEAGVTVRFTTAGKVIIKPGGKLRLKGTLTSRNCPIDTWKGVRVWGTTNDSQYGQYFFQLSDTQGLFRGDGGTIENAEIGITNYGPNTNEQTGGIIRCYNGMVFKNNTRGVHLDNYQNYLNASDNYRDDLSYFKSCNFIIDDDYILQNQFHSFIYMDRINGIKISGGNFTNAQTVTGNEIIDWGYGIFAEDSRFSVTAICTSQTAPCSAYEQSTFTGLGEAIAQKTNEFQQPYLIKQAIFNNCFIGIRNTLISTANILFNEFNLGDLPPVNFEVQQYGVIFEGGIDNMNCEENTFTGIGSNTESIDKIGIYSLNTGVSNKVIRKNTFNNLSIGNFALGTNGVTPQPGNPSNVSAGLVYLCNENYNLLPNQYDIRIATGFGNHIKEDQGLEEAIGGIISYKAAGNRFSNVGTDFRSHLGTAVNYYYNPNGDHELPTFSGNLFPIQAEENTCATDFCEPPCKTNTEISLIKNQYYTDKSIFNTLETVNTQQPSAENSKELGYYQRIMDESINTVVMHALYDTIDYDPDSLLIWIGHKNSISSELWRMRIKVGEGDFNTAYSILNNIPQNFVLSAEQLTDINNTANVLAILNGKEITNLDEATITLLKDYDDVKGNAELWTQNILALYGYYYPPRYENNEEGGPKNLANPSSGSRAKGNKTYLSFQPNPASQYVTFSIEDLETIPNGQLLIKNIQGQVIFKHFVTSYDNIQWEVKDNPTGIYFYQLISNGEALQSGKIIINK